MVFIYLVTRSVFMSTIPPDTLNNELILVYAKHPPLFILATPVPEGKASKGVGEEATSDTGIISPENVDTPEIGNASVGTIKAPTLYKPVVRTTGVISVFS